MKKTIAFILTLIIALTFIETNVYANMTEDQLIPSTLTEVDKSSTKENFNSLMENGTATVTETKTKTEETEDGEQKEVEENETTEQRNPYTQTEGTIGNGALKILLSVLIVIPKLINEILTLIISEGKQQFTIENLLMGKYDLFDIQFWKTSSGHNADIVNSIRNSTAVWYYSIRNIAAVAMIVILIYTGVRMAIMIASSNEQNAKKMARYKKLFVNWLVGIALVFVLHLLMIVIIKISALICDTIVNLAKSSSTGTGLETDIINNTWTNLWSKESKYAKHQFYYFIIYCMLAYYELKFFVIYLTRAIKIYFFVIISPLVCMTYAVDKIGDDRSQAFDNWKNEFLSAILIRPVQLALYTVFIFSAVEIMSRVPLLAIVLLALLSHTEDVVKQMLLRNNGKFGKGLKDVHMRDFDLLKKLG